MLLLVKALLFLGKSRRGRKLLFTAGLLAAESARSDPRTALGPGQAGPARRPLAPELLHVRVRLPPVRGLLAHARAVARRGLRDCVAHSGACARAGHQDRAGTLSRAHEAVLRPG